MPMSRECASQLAGDNHIKVEHFSFILAIFISFCFCILFGISLFTDERSSQLVLDMRINPNDAAAASLMRLPGIGRVKAEAIISYRDQRARENAGAVFTNCLDLEAVSGIGPKTVENICEWLRFE